MLLLRFRADFYQKIGLKLKFKASKNLGNVDERSNIGRTHRFVYRWINNRFRGLNYKRITLRIKSIQLLDKYHGNTHKFQPSSLSRY